MTARDIQEAVAADAGVTMDDLLGPRRNRRLARVRHVAIYLCRRLLDLSYPELAREFQRDHTTCIYAVRAVQMDSRLMSVAVTLRMQLEAPVMPPAAADPEEVMA